MSQDRHADLARDQVRSAKPNAVAAEPMPRPSRKIDWESMRPRLAAVGLADFPATQPSAHAVYILMGPDGEWVDREYMSVDDALAASSMLFTGIGTEVEICERMFLRASVDAEDVIDDVLESISHETRTDDYESLFDEVTRIELNDLSRRLTACFDAWLEDTGNPVNDIWYGALPRRFRRAFDGTWEEVA